MYMQYLRINSRVRDGSGGGPKVKYYIIQYHKLIVTVHTAVGKIRKRSKELSSYVCNRTFLASSVRV